MQGARFPGFNYAFAWNVNGRHRVVTNGVHDSAYSPANGGPLHTTGVNSVERRSTSNRAEPDNDGWLAIHPAREHGSRQPNRYAVHGSPSRCAIFSGVFNSACRPRSHTQDGDHHEFPSNHMPNTADSCDRRQPSRRECQRVRLCT